MTAPEFGNRSLNINEPIMKRLVLTLLLIVATGIALEMVPSAEAEVRRPTPQHAFSSGAMRSEVVLKEIAATLRSIDARLARLETTVSTIATRKREIDHHAPSKTTGWIGVDRGSAAIKVAQLRRVGDALRISAAAIAPRWRGDQDEHHRVKYECESLRALAPDLKGRAAAAVLSMEGCLLEPHTPEDAPPRADGYTDAWEAAPGSLYSLKAPEDAVDSLFRGVSQAGLHCGVIDGPPLALARAMTLAAGTNGDDLYGALDLGSSCATFVAGKRGVAQYARKVSDRGMNDLIAAAAEGLSITAEEAEGLCYRHGLASCDDATGDALRRLLLQELKPLEAEMKRTLSHLGGKLKTRGPEKIFLHGLGGLTPGLPEALTDVLGVPTEPWRFGGEVISSPDAPPQCLLGQAVALSALAWEATP